MPGVALSGTFVVQDDRLQTATITVSGVAAATGVIRIGSGATVSGTLGGTHFDVETAKVTLARVVVAANGLPGPSPSRCRGSCDYAERVPAASIQAHERPLPRFSHHNTVSGGAARIGWNE